MNQVGVVAAAGWGLLLHSLDLLGCGGVVAADRVVEDEDQVGLGGERVQAGSLDLGAQCGDPAGEVAVLGGSAAGLGGEGGERRVEAGGAQHQRAQQLVG